MTNTKEIPSLLDGNQLLLMIGRIPRTRIPRNATPFPAIRTPLCLRPNLGETLHDIGPPIQVRMNRDSSFPYAIHLQSPTMCPFCQKARQSGGTRMGYRWTFSQLVAGMKQGWGTVMGQSGQHKRPPQWTTPGRMPSSNSFLTCSATTGGLK